MKKLVLTGLANEVVFGSEGEARYLLVFNGGEVRLPTTEEGAQQALEIVHGNAAADARVDHVHDAEDYDAQGDEVDDDDFEGDGDGSEFFSYQDGDAASNFTDEDGISQI